MAHMDLKQHKVVQIIYSLMYILLQQTKRIKWQILGLFFKEYEEKFAIDKYTIQKKEVSRYVQPLLKDWKIF